MSLKGKNGKSTKRYIHYTPPVVDTASPTAGTLTATAISSSQIDLSLSGQSDNVGIDHIIISWSPNGTDTWTELDATWDGSTYNHTGLTASTQYFYRAVVYDAAGNNAAATANATTQAAGAAFANALWYDTFNYTVTRASMTGQTLTDNDFVNAAGSPWFICKSEEFDAGAKGYLYTVDPTTDIPGNTVNPSPFSSRALCIEGVSASEYAGAQGDFYLQRGDGVMDETEVLPADVWIQFWFNMYGPTRAGSMKFLYPCRASGGSCNDLSWLFMIRGYAGNPTCENAVDDGDSFFFDWGDNGQAGDTVTWPSSCDGDPKKKGVQIANASFSTVHNSNVNKIDYNQWYLIKLHYDTSGTTGNMEMWARKYGDATWYKLMDWRSGIAPDASFVWNLAAGSQGNGHRQLRIPTTWDTNDCKIYMEDFQVATSEANLENGYTDA